MPKRIPNRSRSLKEWRERHALSQADAAKQFGTTQSAWAKWEAGLRHPRQKKLKSLHERTGVSVEALMGVTS